MSAPQTSPLEMLISTGNRGKIEEIRAKLNDDLPLILRFPQEFCLQLTVEEWGNSYQENAIIKAKAYSQQTGLWALADDSGLEVDALDGAPGVRSARYAGPDASDEQRIMLLLSQLENVPDQERRARFVCVIVIADCDVIHVASGKCEGKIAHAPRGNNGFGFDPIFIPENYESTFAELPAEIKNTISHRARALAKTRDFLYDLLSKNQRSGGRSLRNMIR